MKKAVDVKTDEVIAEAPTWIALSKLLSVSWVKLYKSYYFNKDTKCNDRSIKAISDEKTKYRYLAITNDEYEFIIADEPTEKALGEKLKVSESMICRCVKGSCKTVCDKKYRIERIEDND